MEFVAIIIPVAMIVTMFRSRMFVSLNYFYADIQ